MNNDKPVADVRGGLPKIELIGPSGDGCHIAVNGEHYAYGNLEVNAWKAALRKALAEVAELKAKLATGRSEVLMEALKAVENERLDRHEDAFDLDARGDSDLSDGDLGYSNAIRDAENAIKALLPTPPEATQ